MAHSEAVSLLKKISIFEGMGGADLKRLASIARVHQVPKGILIFEKRMAGNHLFVVMKGRIKIYSGLDQSNKKKTFAYLEPGDFFGEMSLLDKKGRSLSAQAMEETELLTISRKEFQRLLLEEPQFTLNVTKTLIERLRRANEEIEALTFRSLYGRVCRQILEMAKKYGKGGKSGGSIPMSVTHAELADLAGTAREMVTKVLSSLRRLRVIDYEDHRIRILSDNKLKELSQSEN